MTDSEEPIKVRLDIGCGKNKRKEDNNGKPADYIGVDMSADCGADIVHDVRITPWPWEDNSIDEIHTSHFLEHLTGEERIVFFNEAYRVLKLDGKMNCITPAPFTHRYMQDPTHKFPCVVQEFYDYLHAPSRKVMQIDHYPIHCNFEWVGHFMEDERAGLLGRNDEYRSDRARYSINTMLDLIVLLTKKAMPEVS